MKKGILFFGLVLSMFAGLAVGQDDERAKGIALYRAGNHAEAIVVLQRLVNAEPKNKIAWTYLGGALQNTGKTKEAVEAFKKPSGGPKLGDNLDKDLKITTRPQAQLTQLARDNGLRGRVEVMVEFNADGTIGFVVPVRKLMFGLTESAVDAAERMVFEPAMKDGKPTTVIRMVTYTFSQR